MKEPMLVWISKDLKDELYSVVKAKYQGLRGGLSLEVEEALKFWLREHAHTNAHKNVDPRLSRVEQKLMAILKIMRDQGLVQQFTKRDFEVACAKVAGSDPRTIKKYLNWAERLGLIRHKVGVIWEMRSPGGSEVGGSPLNPERPRGGGTVGKEERTPRKRKIESA